MKRIATVLIYLVCFLFVASVVGANGASVPQPTQTAQATYTAQPSYTPYPSLTPLPTYTPFPPPGILPPQDKQVYLAFVIRNRGCWWCGTAQP